MNKLFIKHLDTFNLTIQARITVLEGKYFTVTEHFHFHFRSGVKIGKLLRYLGASVDLIGAGYLLPTYLLGT